MQPAEGEPERPEETYLGLSISGVAVERNGRGLSKAAEGVMQNRPEDKGTRPGMKPRAEQLASGKLARNSTVSCSCGWSGKARRLEQHKCPDKTGNQN